MNRDDYCEIIQKSSPKLMYCEHFDEDSDKWDFSRHSHPYIELIFFLEGKADLEVGGQTLKTTLYDTLVYPAGMLHRDGLSPERTREIICLWVDIPQLVLTQPIILHERRGTLKSLFQLVYRFGKEEENDPYRIEYALKLLLTEVMFEAFRASGNETRPNAVVPYILEHYTEKITLEELAFLEHISVSYLARRFKETTGMTIISYIHHLRIEKARELLISSSLTASEISYMVGFDSPKYFHRIFKKETGESPAQFRRTYTKQQTE